ncbi:regulator of hypoxia-inducible factor 1 [Acyrthosiphon pisum]|uniref:Nose resistant-to-fluoxetine protein N-terminal domain-containing protein n=1 Tax=Acyrthosiphon pisum TaxID=7029 RepID=A0A8R1VY92_ACYPI|nr:regulator of hypoxia-inducible factor 1 [Acyrthosiphon pisum]|eukprot:XP_001942708.2 PREDICTED: regulator of hypoxia-inducible factor 1 [Acyrthosiphon pisum]
MSMSFRRWPLLVVLQCFVAFVAIGPEQVLANRKCDSKHFAALNGSGFNECHQNDSSSSSPTGQPEPQRRYAFLSADDNKNVSFLVQRDMYRDNKQNEILLSNTIQGLFFASPPMSVLSSSNELCKNHSQIYLRELEKLTIWALRMYDSSAKIPSGILNGNINQFGDFDQCLRVNDENSGIQGQYCLTYVEMTLPSNSNEKLKYIIDLMHSHSAFRSRLEDPGHRVPRFSTMNWAVCTPASCSPADIEHEMYLLLSKYIDTTEINLRLKVDPDMCQTYRPSIVPTTGSLIAVSVFGVLFLVIILSTVMDKYNMFQSTESTASKVLYSFSLKRNVRQLLSVNESPEDIRSVHGIRALNALMLLASHKSMAMFFNPYSNRTAMTEHLGKQWTVIARAASLYTDPFIFMSGLLTTISFLRHLDRKGTIDLPKEFLSRFARLVPTMGAIILFCTLILPNLGSGPQWNLVVKHHADICEKTWWRNFLFIHNYFGFKNMCLSHTHHIGIDSQLFMVSPLLVWTLWKWPRRSMAALLGLATISTGLRYYVTLTKKLNLFINFGSSVSQMYDTADFSYILPTHRLTVYIMGILLGYCLRYVGRNYPLKSGHLKLGWIVAIGFFYEAFIHPAKMGDIDYVYNASDAANYAAFAPIYWCIFFSWIIFVSYTGNGGFVSSLFSWKGFIVCTRLSYTFYLTQFPVFFYNVGSHRSALEYSFGLIINIKEMLAIIMVSVALTVAVEMPFNNIRTSFVKKSSRHETEAPTSVPISVGGDTESRRNR